GSHHDSTKYAVENGKLMVTLKDGKTVGLQDESKFVGYQGEEDSPSSVLLKNNGLHIDIQIDADHPIGKTDAASVKDVVLESAVTSIMDCEDSVTAVDAADKLEVYQNWLGLIRGELSTSFRKGDETI